ncbi:MAG TPA: NlpC/P60 family protein [Actinomycetes bacterium]|nr:NlpC/P60 family protein [Actinomycetes bacterium]
MPPLGARRTPHRRWPRHAARSVLLAAILLPLTVLSTGLLTASATPATSTRLEDQLDRQNREADALVEQYNQSNEALKEIRRSLKGLRAEASGAQDDLRKLQATLGARASAAYTQGAGSAVAAVLGSDDPAAAIARVQVLDLLAAHDGDLMDQLGVAGQAFDERQRNLVAAEKAQAAEVERLAAKKAEVERAADKTRALLARMRAADRPAAPSAPSSPVAPPPSGGGGGGSGSAAAAVAYARAQVGKPYCYGGSGPGCFDCSGLTMMAWAQAGVSLPHSSASQYNVGRRISASELQPGDLIFYYSPISHVSIYIGGGQRISATHTGDYVRVQSLGSSIVGYARPNG